MLLQLVLYRLFSTVCSQRYNQKQIIILTLTMASAATGASTEAPEGGGEEVTIDPKALRGFERRTAILQELIANSTSMPDGSRVLNFGAKTSIASKFNVSPRTVYSIWEEGLKSAAANDGLMTLENRMSRRGRKRKEVDLSNIETIPLQQRETIRSTAHALGTTTWQVWRSTQENRRGEEGRIQPVKAVVKPALKDYHLRDRIDYAISQMNLTTGRFIDNLDCVHVDEKWFNIKQVSKKYYLGPNEPEPERSTRHKSHITKVMFLCAVARPRTDPETGEYFDGKIGIWPFVRMAEAKITTRNRPAGTMEMKNLSVDKDVYIDYFVNEVIPAIEEKWPAGYRNRPVYIQHDNARAHSGVNETNHDIREAINGSELDIQFKMQPAQSPDSNVLDLGYFASIQSLQQKIRSKNIEELVEAVEQSFEACSSHSLNKVWLTHQRVMEEIIRKAGSNQYKLPHMNKDKLYRQGQLPLVLEISNDVKDKIKELRPNLQVGGMEGPENDIETGPEDV